MSGTARSAGSTLRKLVAAIVLIPLAIVIVAFAVANRQTVTLSLDPFSSTAPAASLTLPLFALILGVLIGGSASWLRHGRWRRAARRLEREAGVLRRELDMVKGAAGGGPKIPQPAAGPPERLQLRPPVR